MKKWQVKCLLEQLQNMYNELTDKNEITIMKKYGNYAKCYTAGVIRKKIAFYNIIFDRKSSHQMRILLILKRFVVSVVFLAPGPLLYLHWPYLVNGLLSKNDFRSRSSFLLTEYFVDQQKYSYLILFHTLTALFIGIITIIATGTLFVVYLQYGCGMFRIAK